MSEHPDPWSLASAAVYQAPDPATGAIAPPIHVSSSFQYDAEIYQEVVAGARETVNIYGRCGNPGERLFQDHLARLEGADAVLATASGMAAVTTAIFGLLKQGDHLVCDWTTYSSTHEFLAHRPRTSASKPPLWTWPMRQRCGRRFSPTPRPSISRPSPTPP